MVVIDLSKIKRSLVFIVCALMVQMPVKARWSTARKITIGSVVGLMVGLTYWHCASKKQTAKPKEQQHKNLTTKSTLAGLLSGAATVAVLSAVPGGSSSYKYLDDGKPVECLILKDDRLQGFSVDRYVGSTWGFGPVALARVQAFKDNYATNLRGYFGIVKRYKKSSPVQHGHNHKTVIEVWDMDTFEAAKKLLPHKPVVLDMANEMHPGGGPQHGCSAQEEQLCYRSSDLFTALVRCKEAVCGKNWFRDTKAKRAPFITESGALYIPQVRVVRDCEANNFRRYAPAEVFAVDVIASAAYDLRGTSEPKGYGEGTKEKIRTQLRIALEQGHDTLLLSAYGCGAFVNDPAKVSLYYKEVLAEPQFKTAFKRVVFSIFGGGNNRQVFAKTFGC